MRSLPFFAAAGLLVAGFCAPAAQAQNIKSTFIAGGLIRLTWVGSIPGDTHRIFALEQDGRVRIVKDGVLLASSFLDIDPLVGSSGNEQGLLGLAFDPNYSTSGFFYVYYTDNSGMPTIRRYTVMTGNADLADPASGLVVWGPITHPQSNHNGGCIQFGPDGDLYVGIGDGGNANDTGAGHNPAIGNAQDGMTYLGKILRLDFTQPAPYIPPTNPFVGNPNFLPLIWAYGMRNPWRFSFDRQTGDMWIGDVGQGAWEEVDYFPAGNLGGMNCGWRCMEGLSCTGLTGCTCNAPALTLPIYNYNHSAGNCSIIGGYVYRGSSINNLAGTYFFSDYCTGKIWTMQYVAGSVVNFTDRTAQLAPGGGHAINNPTTYGEDGNGELLIGDQGGGEIYRIDQVCPAPSVYCTSTNNSTSFPANMSASGGGSIAANNLTLLTYGCPPSVNGIYFFGDGQTQVPLGNGFRCIGSNFVRLPVVQTDAGGSVSFPFNNTTQPSIVAGATKNFQFWYRDPAGGGALFNLTDALAVTFCAP